jgi:hypothetical protein
MCASVRSEWPFRCPRHCRVGERQWQRAGGKWGRQQGRADGQLICWRVTARRPAHSRLWGTRRSDRTCAAAHQTPAAHSPHNQAPTCLGGWMAGTLTFRRRGEQGGKAVAPALHRQQQLLCTPGVNPQPSGHRTQRSLPGSYSMPSLQHCLCRTSGRPSSEAGRWISCTLKVCKWVRRERFHQHFTSKQAGGSRAR